MENNNIYLQIKELQGKIEKSEKERLRMEAEARDSGDQLREMAEKVFQLLERLKLAELGKTKVMEALKKKEQSLVRLRRLMPGSSVCLKAMCNDSGEITTEPCKIAVGIFLGQEPLVLAQPCTSNLLLPATLISAVSCSIDARLQQIELGLGQRDGLSAPLHVVLLKVDHDIAELLQDGSVGIMATKDGWADMGTKYHWWELATNRYRAENTGKEGQQASQIEALVIGNYLVKN